MLTCKNKSEAIDANYKSPQRIGSELGPILQLTLSASERVDANRLYPNRQVLSTVLRSFPASKSNDSETLDFTSPFVEADAIAQYSTLFRRSEGLFLSYPHEDRMEADYLAATKGRDIELVGEFDLIFDRREGRSTVSNPWQLFRTHSRFSG